MKTTTTTGTNGKPVTIKTPETAAAGLKLKKTKLDDRHSFGDDPRAFDQS